MENISEILGAIIVMAPLVIFLIIMVILRKALLSQSIKIAEILTEIEVQPPTAGAPSPPPKRSASRFILFLSGLTTLVLATCITTYYFYMKIYCINCQEGLNLQEYTDVMLALGLGVVPYAVNKVSSIRL